MSKAVDVTISGTTVSVSVDPLPMGNGHNQEITWRIATDGWTFTSTGIAFYAPDSQWTDKGTSAQGKQYKWHDKNTNNLTYAYGVTVTNGTSTLNLDPGIINQGDSLT